ncbi:MAG: hypothetical protein H6703_03680 [Myxococcales bacterium]|nr:hypothetical protein [Myxococcales bacterium]MCB9541532.1 hypothetical protein [Myxococcales bacterium]
MRAPALIAAALLLAGCVEQTAPLTVTVAVAPVVPAAVETPMGSLAVSAARLDVAAVELVPCATATAWRFVGVAHAHGGEGDAGLSAAVDGAIDPLAGPRTLAAIAVPPGERFCGLRVVPGAGVAVGLAGTIAGARHDWSSGALAGPPLPVAPFGLDAANRAATVTLHVELALWTADLPPGDEAAQARVIAANALAALSATVEGGVR